VVSRRRAVLACGSRAAEPSRCYAVDIASAKVEPVTPEGTQDGTVSRDGKIVIALGATGKYLLYPLDGSAPRPLPGAQPDERPIQWGSDGRSVLMGNFSSVPGHVTRVDVATGARTSVAELAPGDRSGALFIYAAGLSADERSYAYSLVRSRSYLYEAVPGR
jgi:hypothetical protein